MWHPSWANLAPAAAPKPHRLASAAAWCCSRPGPSILGWAQLFFRDYGGGQEGLRQAISPCFIHLECNRVRKKAVEILRLIYFRVYTIQLVLIHFLEELSKSCDLIRHFPPERRFPF